MRTFESSAQRGLFTLFLASTLVACGGGDVRVVPYESSFEPERPVADLSETEVRTLCEEQVEFARELASSDDARRIACTLAAVSLAPTQGLCERLRDECLEAAPEVPADAGDDLCAHATAVPECEATIEEIEVCVTETVHQTRVVLDQLDCDLAGSPRLPEILESAAAIVESCSALRTSSCAATLPEQER